MVQWKNGVRSRAMCPPPARSSIACSITPRSSLSTGEATDSSQKLNNPLRSAPDRPKQAQIRHKRHFPETGPLHLFRLELALADLRAKSSDRILRLIAVRSFLAHS